MGKNGLISVLQTAKLPQLIDCFPQDNLTLEFDFADYAALFVALDELYGPTGGQGLALRAGRAMLPIAVKQFGGLPGITEVSMQLVPLPSKIRLSLMALAHTTNETSDQHASVRETQDEFLYNIHPCGMCWGRKKQAKPACYFTTGFLKEGLKWISGGREFRVWESACQATGGEACEFIIPKEPMN
ncbi:MAG TPA: 4-vinyl reductase [Anaerolineaceae bacterium]|nr:4-vinyl reductase [Anaerolineaceae bacterium]